MTAWSLKTGHGFLRHHAGEAKHPVCEAGYEHNVVHIHDERWAKEDCSLCDFVVSVSEVYSLPLLSCRKAALPGLERPLYYVEPFFSKKDKDSVMRRGPPQS